MTEAEYRAHPAVNWSTLKALRDGSPLHYRYGLEHGRKDTAPMATGRAVHTLVLEPHAFADRFGVFDGVKRGKAWDAWCEENPGMTALSPDALDEAEAMAGALASYSPARKYLTADDRIVEAPVFWRDSATGIDCKARPDLVIPSLGVLADLKTTATLDAHRFGLLAARMGYALQMEHYAAGLPFQVERVLLIVVESVPPYDCAVLQIDDLHRNQARRDLDGLLRTLAACRESDVWPGRYQLESFLSLPDYLLDDLTDPE